MDIEIEKEDGTFTLITGVKTVSWGERAKDTVPTRPFKVGDIVRQNGKVGFGWSKELNGTEGVVIVIDKNRFIGVVFTNQADTNSLHRLIDAEGNTLLSADKGRWYNEDELELIED